MIEYNEKQKTAKYPIDIFKGLSKKQIKSYYDTTTNTCKLQMCNPECKDTILEKGTELSPKFIKKFEQQIKQMEKMGSKKLSPEQNKKRRAATLKNIIKQRKAIFGKNTDVLENGFYKKLPKEMVARLKKDGANSGCLPWSS